MKKHTRHETILKMIRDADSNELLSTRELAGNFHVSEATIRRDLQELADAGQIQRQYGGALIKQPLASTDKGQVGLLLGSQIDKYRDPFYNLVLKGADRKLQELGYHSVYVKTFNDIPNRTALHELVTSMPTDAIIILGSSPDDKVENSIADLFEVTVAVTDRYSPRTLNRQIDLIHFDGIGGTTGVVNHLVKLGRKRLGFISGQIDSRHVGFLRAVQAFNLPIDDELIRIVPTGPEGWVPKVGEIGTRDLMSLDNPPDAIVCASDRLAIGSLQWLLQQGYRIPEDIAVTGFDNIPDSEFTYPALTTVHVHKELLGEIAAERAVRRIENPKEIPLDITVPTQLLIRHSCGGRSHTGD